ncbi:GntR family transcriptional regulator [Nonomuraea mesophila]|uniref:GntR family transcriptional regulator n=1 Tax=Nonomuraea mesophila TaxID=2530382 RepID=A0A4R5FIH2_9ACTN|nr:GntR family transcriptional regulator [Nonomuraea mesophila]
MTLANELGNISSTSFREQAARAIRRAIFTGKIAPGVLYSVSALSGQLGVSATPVREAMLDLVSEGLVVAVRSRGYRVVDLTPQDLDHILRLRVLLEVPTSGEIAESRNDDDLPRLLDLAARLPDLATSGDYETYLENDQEFHLGLLALSGNPRLVSIVEKLRNQTRIFDVSKLAASGGLAGSAHEHLEIMKAIRDRDRPRTEELVEHHILRSRRAWPAEKAAGS